MKFTTDRILAVIAVLGLLILPTVVLAETVIAPNPPMALENAEQWPCLDEVSETDYLNCMIGEVNHTTDYLYFLAPEEWVNRELHISKWTVFIMRNCAEIPEDERRSIKGMTLTAECMWRLRRAQLNMAAQFFQPI